MMSHRDRAQQLMADPLFEIANHTWEHRNLRIVNNHTLVDEIKNTQLAYEQVREELEAKQCLARDNESLAQERAPKRLKIFAFHTEPATARPWTGSPYGLAARSMGYFLGDPWIGQTSAMMKREVLAKAQPGSIVLFHANGRGWHTGSALPDIVAGLRSRGFEFVTIKELLAAGEPVWTQDCYDARPGDTDKDDAHARSLEPEYQRSREIFAATRSKANHATYAAAQPLAPTHESGEEVQWTTADASSTQLPLLASADTGVTNKTLVSRIYTNGHEE